MYGAQKSALDHMADNITYNCDYKRCRISTIGLGMLVEDYSSLSYKEVCDMLEYVLNTPTHIEIPRLYIQHADNYTQVQSEKAARYKMRKI